MSDFPTPLNRGSTLVAPAETPGSRGLLFIAVAVVVVAGLYFGRSVLIPITLAMLLSFLLAPLVNLLRRLYFGRVPSVLIAVLLALTVILALGGLIGTQLAALAEEVPRSPSRSSRRSIRCSNSWRLASRAHHRAWATSRAHRRRGENQARRPSRRKAGRRRAKAAPGRGASAGHHRDRARAAHRHTGCRTAVHHRHRVGRLDLHPAAA